LWEGWCGFEVRLRGTVSREVDIGTPEDVQRELIDSRRRLEQELGREVRILAWQSGAPYGENERVDAAVREGGYRLVFSNTKIQSLQSA
jgi:hypothetical protein